MRLPGPAIPKGAPPCHGLWSVFFGPEAERPDERAAREQHAKAICRMCAWKVECGARGLRERHGIWAGLTEAERGFPSGRNAKTRARQALRLRLAAEKQSQ